MIVAGIGCRPGCSAEAIVTLVRWAQARSQPVEALAVPDFRAAEPGLRAAARVLKLPLLIVDDATLRAAQPFCVTRSAVAEEATGFASVAEAAALGPGGELLLPRQSGTGVTCAVARRAARPEAGAA